MVVAGETVPRDHPEDEKSVGKSPEAPPVTPGPSRTGREAPTRPTPPPFTPAMFLGPLAAPGSAG
jgi:hypothetical protein